MGPARKSALIMDLFSKDFEAVEEDAMAYVRSGPAHWTLHLCSAPHVRPEEIAKTVSEMMEQRAFDGSAAASGYSETLQNVDILKALQADGYC